MDLDWEIVPARSLREGDIIEVDCEPGLWRVESVFFEGPEVAALDLVSVSGVDGDLEKHFRAEQEILRAFRSSRP